jgi:hypothetical protein
VGNVSVVGENATDRHPVSHPHASRRTGGAPAAGLATCPAYLPDECARGFPLPLRRLDLAAASTGSVNFQLMRYHFRSIPPHYSTNDTQHGNIVAVVVKTKSGILHDELTHDAVLPRAPAGRGANDALYGENRTSQRQGFSIGLNKDYISNSCVSDMASSTDLNSMP